MFISIDASFGIHGDGKSHSGYAAMIDGGSVEAKSKKQSIVTKHSTEAEMVALSDMLSLAIGESVFKIIRYFFIKDRTDSGEVKLMYMKQLIADIWTTIFNVRGFDRCEPTWYWLLGQHNANGEGFE